MKLTFKKGKGDKTHLSVDDEYYMTVDEGYFLSLRLKNGQNIDENDLLNLKNEIEIRRAYNHAVSLLSIRDHSKKELITKLQNKGHNNGIEEAVEKLEKGGYLNDERFAHMYVRELLLNKNYGKKRIEQELYKKGIDRDIIKETIESAEIPEERLTDVIRKKYLRYLSDEKGVRKTVNALLRLGYSYGEIRDALSAINNELDIGVTDE